METNKNDFKVAYFSMEIALESSIKTYSGGLGILAGDILRSAADLKLPMVGITLLSDQGYFDQKININGQQEALPTISYDFSKLKKLKTVAVIKIGNDKVKVAVWQYLIKNIDGFAIPIYLLDTNMVDNKEEYKSLTGRLYGRDKEYRLLQEIVLGCGGYQILKSLGYNINKFHINEGHGSFVAITQFLNSNKKNIAAKIADTRKKCIFTTHTPIKMAQDIFPLDLVLKYQPDFPSKLPNLVIEGEVNMTKVALYFSDYINGVALSNQQISSQMFPEYPIHSITNGVHSLTWTSPEFQLLFDKHIPNWRFSSLSLRNAFVIPLDEIWEAHQSAKKYLIKIIKEKSDLDFDEKVFTIGFARRFTAYKRPELLLYDMERLLGIQEKIGKIQIVYGGKAHPADEKGQLIIESVNHIIKKYKDKIKIVFLEGYEMDLAKIIIAGVDLWVNTPLPPNEASGTSGMKAAHNGVPQLSSYDGWWKEGYIRDKTGWTIRGEHIIGEDSLEKKDAISLYNLLEQEIMPLYYKDFEAWREIMRFTIGVNASFFNTERVLREYAQDAYL
ncbi:MAG: alpha-glucan family phosphorylase [Patescibacteria group bacterium]|jgi:starch phosphorylase